MPTGTPLFIHPALADGMIGVGLAASLVSMLSPKTAMFSSLGQTMVLENQQSMNLLTDTTVCSCLTVLGITMVMAANKK